ncbi:MAG: hypothetical protein Q9173_005597 [Seirophora scorigena]
MTRLSPRLSARLIHLKHILPQSSSPHVCLQCRYRRTSLQQVPSTPLTAASYSTPLLHRTYATSPLETFQENFSQGIKKRIFKDDEVPPRDGNRDPPLDTVPVDDVDYKPAVSGEELERVGGPSGWWEEAWDAEHQFAGYMRPRPLCKPIEVQEAIRRALVEAVVLRQEPRGSPLKSTIERLLQEAGHATRNTKRSKRQHLEMNFRRRPNVPAIGGFNVSQAVDGEIKLKWTRQEDRDEMYAFLETSAQESILKEPDEERTDETKAGEELDLTKQEAPEKYLSSLETSAQEQESTVAKESDDSAVDQSDEAQFPKAWDAPEEGEVGTERATGESSASEDPVSLDTTERLSMTSKEEAFHNFEGVIELSDRAIKFAVIKRAMQLTGTRIPDPVIQSIETINDLYRNMTHQPEPKKLADRLMQQRRQRKGAGDGLMSLSNVELLPTRYRHSMAQAALGRQKVIEKRLNEYGIQEPWKDAMEQIEEYERRRLQRHQNTSRNRGSEFDSLGGAAERDASVGHVMDLGPIEPAPIEPAPIGPDPIVPDPINQITLNQILLNQNPIESDSVEADLIEPDAIQSDPNKLDSIEPDPIEPAPFEPDPTEPDSIESAPIEPDPIEPDPIEPNSIEPDPIEPDSIKPDPLESDHNISDPIESDSIEPAAVEPDPNKSDPIEPDPIKSDPSNADSPVSERHPDDGK